MPKKETEKITLGLVLSWFFGVIFGGSGLFYAFGGELTVGIPYILASLVLLPPFNQFIKYRFGLEISRGLRIILVIVFIVWASTNMVNPDLETPLADNIQPDEKQEINEEKEPKKPTKVKSATISIDRVPITAANLGKIRITVENTGDLSITPKFDVIAETKSGEIICDDSPLLLGFGSISAGEKKTDEIQILACIFEKDGDYDVTVDILDENFNKLDSATEEVTVNYWGKFGL